MNGYQTGPSAPVSPGGFLDIPGIMRRTRPWVVFMAVLSFVGAGFMALALLALVTVSVMEHEGMPLFIAIPVYGFGLVLQLVLGIFLFRYASRIARYVAEPGEALLAEALEAQRVYWKFMGILTIVAICLGIVAGIAAVILGVMAALG